MEKRLSRGLEALLGKGGVQAASTQGVQSIPIDQIRPNPRQPRKEFDPRGLESLKESIARDGLLQPIVVRRAGDGYELIAGERRWRACAALEMPRIPALVRTTKEEQQLALALVENLQRSDLNPMEEARAFRQLQEDFGLTHDEIARRVAKERSTITNSLRLLELSPGAQEAVSRGTISAGHARALLPLCKNPKFGLFLQRIISEGLNVRQTERVVRELLESKAPATGEAPAENAASMPPDASPSPNMRDWEERIRALWGSQAVVRVSRRGGEVSFRCSSKAELDDLLKKLVTATWRTNWAQDPPTSADAELPLAEL